MKKTFIITSLLSLVLFGIFISCKTAVDSPDSKGSDPATNPPNATEADYTVNYKLQNINDDNYTLKESVKLNGTAGTKTKAEAKTYTGFTALDFSQKDIAEDGSTVIDVLYNRNIITFTFDTDGGSAISPISGKYESTVTKPANPTKTDLLFAGWDSEIPNTFPSESKTFKAKWEDSAVGIIDKVSFELNVPAETISIEIFRKKAEETEWKFISVIGINNRTAFPSTLTFEDPFVISNKTYNYKCLFISDPEELSDLDKAIDIKNGDSINFTPINGYGEIQFKGGFPDFTYDSLSTVMSLSKCMEAYPETVPEGYSTAFFLENNYRTSSIYTYNFSETQIKLKDTCFLSRGTQYITGIGLGFNFEDLEEGISYWYYGKTEDISGKNIIVTFPPETIILENTDNGILVQLYKRQYENWLSNATTINFYEDDKLMDYFYWLESNAYYDYYSPHTISFILPFVQKGKKYTVKFNTSQTNKVSASIIATKSTPLQLDTQKLNQCLTGLTYSFTGSGTSSSGNTSIKISKDATDLFNTNPESVLKYFKLSLVFIDSYNTYITSISPSSKGYAKLIGDGLDIYDESNLNLSSWETQDFIINALSSTITEFNILMNLCFSFEEENEYGYYGLLYPTSQYFTWGN